MNFHSPNWLYLALVAVVAIVAIYAWAARTRAKNLRKFASLKLLPELSKSYSGTKSKIKAAMFTLGVVAIFIALARPQYGYRWEETRAKGVDVIFAIDTSKSMLAEDIAPNRLERAKLAVLDLAEMLKGDRIGIVAFSGQAFLQCPLTLDYDAFRMSLEALDTNVIQRGGTNIAAAITEAETAFAKTSAKKILVLISDGEELEASALSKSKDAAKNGVTIYTLGVGGVKGEAITITNEFGRSVKLRDESGKIVTSKLNEKVLSEIANATGGFYGKISSEAVEKIFTDGIKKAPQEELASRMKRLAIERFQIPLAIAILLLALESLVGTRRFFIRGGKTLSAVALLCALSFAPDTMQAQETLSKEIKTSSEQPTTTQVPEKPKTEIAQENQKPDARELFNSGIDLYKKGEYAQAKLAFEDAMKLAPEDFNTHSKAIYNIANAEYKMAVNPLVDVSSPAEIAGETNQAVSTEATLQAQGNSLLQQGKPLLKQEQENLSKAKTKEEKETALKNSPLKNQQFQQQLKQVISQCETIQKLPDELDKKITSGKTAWEKSLEDVKHCADLYADSLNLDPNFSDAKTNLKIAQESAQKLQSQNLQFDNLKTQTKLLRERFKKLEELKNELKKLVRDDNNQNNQQNQDQQNNQNQNNQQNQNQNNQDKNQSQQDKKDNSNKDKSDKNQDQDKNDQNKQDNKDKSQADKDKNKINQNGDERKDEKNQDKSDKSDKSKDEQAIENKPEQKQDKQTDKAQQQPDKAKEDKQQSSANPAEQKQAQEQKAQSAQSAGDKEENQDNYRKAEGVMTKAEAKNLLESMKDGEKILPLRGFGEQKQRFEKSYKDW